jgi:hypothetical protein
MRLPLTDCERWWRWGCCRWKPRLPPPTSLSLPPAQANRGGGAVDEPVDFATTLAPAVDEDGSERVTPLDCAADAEISPKPKVPRSQASADGEGPRLAIPTRASGAYPEDLFFANLGTRLDLRPLERRAGVVGA